MRPFPPRWPAPTAAAARSLVPGGLVGVLLGGALALHPVPAATAPDADLLAHRLYAEGRAAEAAEIFTDPAWKGVALYRSGQWWRAADAFVRADDPLSAHNLGNCYVRLGYYALALGAYRRALAADPTLADARHNAALMVRLLEREDRDEDGASGASPSGEEIERIASEEEPEARGDGTVGEDEEDDARGQDAPGTAEERETGRGPAERAERGDGGEADDAERDPPGEGGGDPRDGEIGDEEAASRASGTAESDAAREGSEAAGLRSALESEQATEQWLNRIAHDPGRFLERRIALEIRRRRAAGQGAPEGGSVW